jgi:hypothetical protein
VPITISVVDHDRPYLEAVASGPVQFEEVRAHLLDERRYGGLSYPELMDARAATPDWSSRETRDIVELLGALGRDSTLGPTAVVVSGDYAFGMLRMLEIMLEILVDEVCVVRSFHSVEEARHWLSNLA